MRTTRNILILAGLLLVAACDMPTGPSPVPGAPLGGVLVQQDSGAVAQAQPHRKPD